MRHLSASRADWRCWLVLQGVRRVRGTGTSAPRWPSERFSNRKIAAPLPKLCSRQVERRGSQIYCDFTTGSAFSATGQLPTRGALDTQTGAAEMRLRLPSPLCSGRSLRATTTRRRPENAAQSAQDFARSVARNSMKPYRRLVAPSGSQSRHGRLTLPCQSYLIKP